MKFYNYLQENRNKDLKRTLYRYKSRFAKIAQKVYDNWDEENIDTYAGGGICHLIAEEFCDFLARKNIDCFTMNTSIGTNHVWAVAYNEENEEAYDIDIPPYMYEEGGGFSWNKIPDVKFDKNDIIIEYHDWDDVKFMIENEW